jgi:hypothetical protein
VSVSATVFVPLTLVAIQLVPRRSHVRHDGVSARSSQLFPLAWQMQLRWDALLLAGVSHLGARFLRLASLDFLPQQTDSLFFHSDDMIFQMILNRALHRRPSVSLSLSSTPSVSLDEEIQFCLQCPDKLDFSIRPSTTPLCYDTLPL